MRKEPSAEQSMMAIVNKIGVFSDEKIGLIEMKSSEKIAKLLHKY